METNGCVVIGTNQHDRYQQNNDHIISTDCDVVLPTATTTVTNGNHINGNAFNCEQQTVVVSRRSSPPVRLVKHVTATIPDEDLVWECVEVLMQRSNGTVSQVLREHGIHEGDDDSESEEGLLWNHFEANASSSTHSSTAHAPLCNENAQSLHDSHHPSQ